MAIRDPERYFDRRTIKRHLKRGHASEEDYKAYIEALPDLADNITPKDEGGDDDGFEVRMEAKAKVKGEAQVSSAPYVPEAEAPAQTPAAVSPPVGDPPSPA